MTTDRDFDRIAAAWLADGPEVLSDRVLDAVVDRIHLTRQRRATRVPWRFTTMSMSARVAALIAVGALVAVGLFAVGGIGQKAETIPPPTAPAVVAPSLSATTSPPATAAPISLDATFVSPWHGYSVSYPSDWTATPSTAAWMPGTTTLWGDPALDDLRSDDIRFSGTSQLFGSQSGDEWLVSYCEEQALDCADPKGSWESTKVDGHPAYVDWDGVPALPGTVAPGGMLFEVVVPYGDRGYVFTMDGALDRATFDAFLATITLSPGDAIDLPPLTGTFTSPTYGYSAGVADGWSTHPASQRWRGYDNEPPNMDGIDIGGTDTGLGAASQRLVGQTYDAFLAAFHESGIRGAAPGCDGGDPAAWPAIQIGDQTGGLEMMCNAAEALVHVGDRVYVFDWGNSTFETGSHLPLRSWEEWLKSVAFDPESAKK
jgi:hypothetical protein